MSIQTINPATGKVISTYQEMSEQEVNTIINACHQSFLLWSQQDFAERGKKMLKAAEILLNNKDKYASLITQEMGKPISQAKAEIEKCVWVCRHFAESAADYLALRNIQTNMSKSYVAYKPLGIVFAIMPWNFPFWQVFRFAVPALMAGNAALLKHAPISTGAGLAIEQIFKQAGLPENLFRTLLLTNKLAEKVIENPHIAAVTLTGSDRTGKIVGSHAAGSLKKVILEMGGNDPYLILADADLELAAEAAVSSRMNNAGQVCIAAKRLIAVEPIREAFEKLVLQKLSNYTHGDPTHIDTKLGPLARQDLRDTLHHQVTESVNLGAQVILGGTLPENPGFYYPPTVLTNVKKGMPAYDEELFGPVITFIDAKDEAEAIQIANDTKYGLSAAIFTKDQQRGEKIAADEIHAGTVFVNDLVRSDPRLPFGGVKNSGFGRELSAEGIREFVNIKTIAVK
ncbi:NAD-dependent succinate-semialdehyde dehydrogenase [soil metagenome]